MGAQTSYSDAQAKGFSGQVDEGSQPTYLLGKNVEASAAMPMGIGVVFKTSSPATDHDMLLPAAQADKVSGIIVFSQIYSRTYTDPDGNTVGDLNGTGLVPGTLFNVLRKGRILVRTRSGCAVGDRLFVRRTAGAGEALGDLENAADSTDMIDCTKQGVWVTSASAGGLAWLSVDFTNEPD